MFVSISDYAKKNNLTVADVFQEIKKGEHQTREVEHEIQIFVSDELADFYNDKPLNTSSGKTVNKTDNYTQAYGMVMLYTILGWLAVIIGFVTIFIESFQSGVFICLIGALTVGFGQIIKAGLDSAINIRKIKEHICNK